MKNVNLIKLNLLKAKELNKLVKDKTKQEANSQKIERLLQLTLNKFK